LVKIVVMIIDEQPSLRTKLRQLMAQGNGSEAIEIIECDSGVDGNEAVAQIDTISPDVVLLDINFPYRDGLVLCRKIVRRTPQTKVVMLTTNPVEDDDELFEAIKSGASAYLMIESCTPQEFTTIIKRASRGEYPINDSVSNKPQIALRVQKQFEEIICNVRKEDDISTPLNPKEVEILALVVKGKANKEIGSILGISESSVKKHISSILRKLNANDRAHAVVLAVRNGLVSIQPNASINNYHSDTLDEASDTIDGSIEEEAKNIQVRMFADAEEVARQLIEEAKQQGEEVASRIVAQHKSEAEQKATHVIQEAKNTASQTIAEAEEIGRQIVEEAKQQADDTASWVLVEILGEAEQQASQIIEEAKQKSENNASRIIAEARNQADQLIEEAKKKAETDSTNILEEGRKAAQSIADEAKTKSEIEANRIIAEAEQKAKHVVEDAHNAAEAEASAVVLEARKKANQIMEEASDTESKMLANAEEITKQLIEEAKQKSENNASRIIAEARNQADQLIEEAKRKAEADSTNILEEGRKAAQSITGEAKTKSEIEANRLIAEAEQKAKHVVEDAHNTAESEASAIVLEAHGKAKQIIEEADNAKSKMLADAEEITKQPTEEARQKSDNNASRIVAEPGHKLSQVIKEAKSQDIEKPLQEGGMSKLYDGVIELAVAPHVNVSTLCALHKQLKQTPNVDVLSVKGSVNEGLRIRMLVKTPLPLLEFIKGISAVKDVTDDEGLVKSQIEEGVKRIVVTTR